MLQANITKVEEALNIKRYRVSPKQNGGVEEDILRNHKLCLSVAVADINKPGVAVRDINMADRLASWDR